MMRRLAVLTVAVTLASAALAQPPAPAAPRFKWEPGKVHTYRVVEHTAVQETTLDEKTNQPVTGEVKTSLTLVRKWTVKDVDKTGVATLEMSITEMKREIRQSDGSVVKVDSTNPADAKTMAEYLNTPIVTVRIDGQGKLIEAKDTKGNNAALLQAELPFRLVLPDAAPPAGKVWDRPFEVVLDPPQGVGQKYGFGQKYTSKGEKDGLLIVGVETSLTATPKLVNEQVPLVRFQRTGDVYFNVAGGKYHAARLKVKKELVNHQGEGTKYVYESVYSEDALDK
jgi:hypothetical protein